MRARALATLTLVGTLAIGMLVVLGDGADAKDKAEFLPAFRTTYPESAGTRIDNCNLCHYTDSKGKREENQFAEDFEEADKSFLAIQNLDSDGDGYTNLQEIQAGTFPGAPGDNPATVVTTTTIAAPPGSGEAIYQTHCAGCHGGNGGNLVPTSLTLNQLVNITTSGRGSMPGYSGTLSAGEIQAVSEYLLNWTPSATTTTAPGSPPPSGSAVYAASCAGCHGAGGGDLIGRNLTVSSVAAVTTNGTTGMPGFSSSLSQAEIDAVSAYVASVSASAPTTTTTAPGAPPPNGSAVFAESCAGCHGTGGGDLVGHSLADSQLRDATVNGQGSMPGFGSRLSSAQIDAVVAFVSSLKADSSTPPTDPEGVDGSALYTKYCASCHGAHGAGGPGGPVAGTTLSRAELISITNDGAGSMPSYSGRMTAEEIAAVADFILGLSETGDTSATGPVVVDTLGAHLYAELCAVCHGAVGEGGPGGAIVGEDADPAELIELLREGDDGMPAYPDLTTEEIDALVEHTLLLMSGEEIVAAVDDVETSDDRAAATDGESLALFLDEQAEDEEPLSLAALAIVVLIGLSVVGGVGFAWVRSARGLAR